MDSPVVRIALLIAFTVLALLNAALSDLELASQRLRFPSEPDTHQKLPRASLVQAASLNYRTAAADLLWIGTILDHTLTVSHENRVSRALKYNVEQLLEVDPRFYPAYEWYAAANLTRRTNVSEADLQSTNEILDIGIETFPSDAKLPYVAALNYIGYSDPRDEDRRIRELTRAISYLKEAAARPDAPTNTPLILGWMQERLRTLKGGSDNENKLSKEEEIEFNRELYMMTQSREMRKAIETNLKILGGDTDALFQEVRDRQNILNERHDEDAPFVPMNLWLSLGANLSNVEENP